MNTRSLQKHKYGQIFAVIVTVGTMLLLPYLVHLITPQAGVSLGARLLPLFYAPLLAVILFDLRTAIIAAFTAPLLNHLIIGSPTLEMAVILTIEVVVFCVVASLLYRQWPRLVIIAPAAYISAVLAAALTLLIGPLLPVPALTFFISSISNALPGMLILLLINIVLVQYISERNAS